MATTEQDKPTAKPRQRSRKGDNKVDNKADNKPDQRNQKVEQTMEAAPDFEPVAEPVSSPVEAPVEPAAAVFTETPAEETVSPALSGEVLPPEVREAPPQAAALEAIVLAYGDYTRNSWQAGRLLVERLIAVRSFDEAVEIQREFARQAFANFVSHSQRICGLYGEWAQQSFAPFEKFAPEWTRTGR